MSDEENWDGSGIHHKNLVQLARLGLICAYINHVHLADTGERFRQPGQEQYRLTYRAEQVGIRLILFYFRY